jgi:hypothetical protein
VGSGGERSSRLLATLVTGVAAVVVLLAQAGRVEGTVVAKAGHGVYHHSCQMGGTVTGPVAVPVWGTCSVPECWRLVVRDAAGNTSEPCVSREEYDRTRTGTFWRGRTDR